MKPYAIYLCLLILCPAPTLAQDSQPSVTSASDPCPGLARACSAAAKELLAARKLIGGYEEQIIASNDRIELAKQEIESLKQLSALQSARATELEAVIAAERTAKEALLQLKVEQEKRIKTLEKKLSRSRKFTWIAVGATAGIVLVLSK